MVRLLNDRKYFDFCKRGLTAPLIVEGADAHEAVGSLFDRQLSVHVFAVHHKRRGFDARFFGVGHVVNLDLVPFLFCPPHVHAHEHLRPVRGIDATGSGTDIDNSFASIVFPREHGGDFEGIDSSA